MTKFQRILCPVDFSLHSERALDYAIGLATGTGATIDVVHVWQIPVYAFPDGAVIFGPEATARLTAELQKALDALLAARSDARVALRGELVEGYTDREITRIAAERSVDLVVMSTHGRTGLSHLVMGSVAERVVRTSTVPVLVVPRARE